MAKSRSDAPSYRVTVEKGRLVPATQFDAERLDSYRNGTRLRVTLSPDNDRRGIRRWWAILHLVIKQTKLGEIWPNTEVASRAVKVALNLVDSAKTADGKWFATPISLNELDDAQLDDALELMIRLLSAKTGIDVSTLQKEAADAGEDEESSSPGQVAPTSDPGGESGDGGSLPVAADQSESASSGTDDATSEAPAASIPAEAGVSRYSRRECVDKMMAIATDPDVPVALERQNILIENKAIWKDVMPNDLEFVKTAFDTANKVLKGELKEALARQYLAGLAK